jgi:hypothetical protein
VEDTETVERLVSRIEHGHEQTIRYAWATSTHIKGPAYTIGRACRLLWGTRKAKGEDELQVRVPGLSGLVKYCSRVARRIHQWKKRHPSSPSPFDAPTNFAPA